MFDAILGKCDLAHITDTERQASLYQTKALYLKSSIKHKIKPSAGIFLCQDKRLNGSNFKEVISNKGISFFCFNS